MYEQRMTLKKYKCLICDKEILKHSTYIRWRTYGGDFKMHPKCHVWSGKEDKEISVRYAKLQTQDQEA